MACSLYFYLLFPLPFPLAPSWLGRGAQRQADQGWRCLSEASLARPRLARAPQVARSEAQGPRLRVAFLLGTFLWRSKEKCLACRATPASKTQKKRKTSIPQPERVGGKASTGSARTGNRKGFDTLNPNGQDSRSAQNPRLASKSSTCPCPSTASALPPV